MQVIPLADTPSQTLAVTLANQACSINVYQKSTGLYLDLACPAIGPMPVGVLCLDTVEIVRDAYWGFIGDLAFFDTMGSADPTTPGIGSRWVLIYLEASDL